MPRSPRPGCATRSASTIPSQIEAPFLHHRGGHYYLLVNWGKCCRGTDSIYEIRVGRSRVVTGPYLDRAEPTCASIRSLSPRRLPLCG